MAAPASPTPAPAIDRPPRPRRWVPLSLRLFAALLFGLGAWTGLRAYRRPAAIRDIERLGGNVITKPRGPDWLRRIAGDRAMRAFDRVIHIQACDREFTDERLDPLRLFPDLIGTKLHRSGVTDRVLDHLTDR